MFTTEDALDTQAAVRRANLRRGGTDDGHAHEATEPSIHERSLGGTDLAGATRMRRPRP